MRLGFLRDMIRGREERLRDLDLKWEDGEMVRLAKEVEVLEGGGRAGEGGGVVKEEGNRADEF